MSSITDAQWDYIIVGGGSAGCALASRLSEKSAVRVLLLDAGRSDTHLYSKVPAAIGQAIVSPAMNWQYSALADKSRGNRIDMWPAGKLLGGGSSINGMMYVRGDRSDYDNWESLGNPGWGFDGVLPYFRRLENSERGGNDFRGAGGPVSVADVRVTSPLTHAFVDGMVELGVKRSADLNAGDLDGVDYCQVTQKRGFRHSAAAAYLAPARARRNLKVQLGAFVERVRFEEKRARHVEYLVNGERLAASASRGVVICAGAIGSPKVLMLSGIGDAKRLYEQGVDPVANVPGVGKNLQEHPGVIVSAHVTERTLTSDRNPLRALMHGANYLLRGRGPLSNPVGHAHAFVRTRHNLAAANVQIIFSPLSYDHHEGGATPYAKPAINMAVGLCHVGSRGEVRLASPDPQDNPIIDYALLDDEDDVRQLLEGIRFARRLYATKAFGKYFKNERKPGDLVVSDDALLECIRQQSFLMYHPSGTCKMGPDDDAVVDARLKVRGVDGLWVADASVFPVIPAGNINASAIMVGEKAADLISSSN